MSTPKSKVKLSPRLQLGVGRNPGKTKLLPYATMIFLVISGVLAIRAGYMVIHRSPSVAPSDPQVLGAKDTPSPEPIFKEYTVKKGDTVFSISQQYNIEWTTVATLNSLKPPFTLQTGQVLKIPKQ